MRLAAALLALIGSTVVATAADLPGCDAAGVLSTLRSRQAWAEANTWRDGVVIAGIDRVRPGRLVTDGFSVIDRRFCVADADLGDGRRAGLYYVVSADEGFAGYGWNVEFCLSGHDAYRVYGSDCKVLK